MPLDDVSKRLFSVEGRNALVTGASSGLGWHFASVLARAGARVTLCARREDLLAHRVQELMDTGGIATAVTCDVTKTDDVARAFEHAEATHGPLEIVINNAGLADERWIRDTSDEDWRRVLDVNLDGVFRVAREAVVRMRASATKGSIINIASVLGMAVLPAVSAYATSKAAVIQLTRSLAVEHARDGIRVNAIAPGYFPSELTSDFLASPAGQKLIAGIPQRRAGDLQELDGPLLLLSSDAGRYMTGSVVTVDGGALLSFA